MADRLSGAQVGYVAMAADQPASYSLSFCPVPFPVISHSLPIPVPFPFPFPSNLVPFLSLHAPLPSLPVLFSCLPFPFSLSY